MDDVVVPPYRVARLDPWDGDESLRRDAVPARIEGQGITGLGAAELVAVDALVSRVAPALDRPAVRVRRQAQRRVARLAPAQSIGVRALSRRVEGGRFGRGLAPHAVQSRSNPRQLIALPRAHLRLRPVEAVNLWRGRGQRGEIAIQTDP